MQKVENISQSFFATLTVNQLQTLLPLLEKRSFGKNVVLFKQGQAADMIYILLKGKVVIDYKPYDGPEITVSHIEPGGVFGWSAALGRRSYSSAAVTTTEVEAFCLSRDRLVEIYQQDPETGIILLETLAGGIAKRLNSTHEQILAILTQGMKTRD